MKNLLEKIQSVERELIPCECGEPARIVGTVIEDRQLWRAECSECMACTMYFGTAEEAREMWNYVL